MAHGLVALNLFLSQTIFNYNLVNRFLFKSAEDVNIPDIKALGNPTVVISWPVKYKFLIGVFGFNHFV